MTDRLAFATRVRKARRASVCTICRVTHSETCLACGA